MIHERLQDLEIKITELSEYLQISRPTLYKFIDAYDMGERSSINQKILKLFDYITENELIDKKNVIKFIFINLIDKTNGETSENQELIRKIKEYISNNPNSEKTLFIESCISKSSYDIVIHYLIEISPLLVKKRLSSKEKKLLEPYKEIIGIYAKQ